MTLPPNAIKGLYIVLACLCLTPWVSPSIALLMGIIVAQVIGNPYKTRTKNIATVLLQLSVIGLGFNTNVQDSLKAGTEGLLLTTVSIVGTIGLGLLLGKLFKVDRITSYLITMGTAICGGSAIAAVGPVVEASEDQMSVSLATVFVLNSVALLVFPWIGHIAQLSQHDFGLWSAIAIHDTSSVVGAAKIYGTVALGVAITVKLTRALWIIPIAFITAFLQKRSQNHTGAKVKLPYFMFGYIAAMCLNTYIPGIQPVSSTIVYIAKIGLTLTLFLIGAGLTRQGIKNTGARTFALGITLWVIVSVVALWAVMAMSTT